jgi:Domain of unknown function (DU1801)
MAELKTKVNDASVAGFLAAVPDEAQRKAANTLLALFRKATGTEPKMWGDSIVGFDQYHYVGKSGRSGDWLLAGFSPRKQNLTMYVYGGWEQHPDLLEKLGKHSLGKGCLYIPRLESVDMAVLEGLIDAAVRRAKNDAQASE